MLNFHCIRTCQKLECLLTGEWINRLWYIHAMEYHSAVKRTVNIHIMMNLKNSMLSEESQTQKALYSMIPFK